MNSPKNIVCIGYGNMGRALMTAWRNAGLYADSEWTVVDEFGPARERAQADGFGVLDVTASIEADIVIAAIKPQQVDVLNDYKITCKLLISILAGTTISKLESLVSADSIVRVMPNTPAMVNQAVCGYFINEKTELNQQWTTELLQCVGLAIEVSSEAGINQVTALTGSGPGFIMEVVRGLVVGAENIGLNKHDIRAMVAQLLTGSAAWFGQSELNAEELRATVTSKGGTTAAGLDVMFDAKVADAMQNAVEQAYARAEELSKESQQ